MADVRVGNISTDEDERPSSSSSSDYITDRSDSSPQGSGSVPFSLKSAADFLSIKKGITEEQLNDMVNKCKWMVLESRECSEERKWLVRRLIELRLRVQEMRESADRSLAEVQVILGHHFLPQKYYITTSGPTYCDCCSGTIWTVLQSWYMCNDCKYSCHWKCLKSVRRVCVHVVASEARGYTYSKDICPEKGLSAQAYRCAECKTKITFNTNWIEPRLCDYSGLYYCQRCHWNSLAVIPARVVRNWDIEPRKVCRAAEQLLSLLENRPVLPLEEMNSKLFSLVPDLTMVKRLREQLQMMKKYLVFCSEANKQGLPWKIGIRTHLIESVDNYSIRDLVDLQTGTLIDEIRSAYDQMHLHITESCALCKARGHRCELCDNKKEVIYPWDDCAIVCNKCNTVHHRVCYSERNHVCPRCIRIEKRALKDDANESELAKDEPT